MMKIISIVICLVAIVAINYKVSSQKNGDTFASVLELQQALAETPESGTTTKPEGKSCGDDDCEVSYSVGVYTVTESGTYYHCKTADSGTCSSSSCDVKCDAL